MGNQSSTLQPREPIQPVPVYLHVYDVGQDVQVQAINSILEAVGTGAFHCGVEVYGHEFGFNYKPIGTGVFKCPPRSCPGHRYRTTVSMGYITMSPTEIERVLYVLRQDWQGPQYHIINRNCCAFCDEFCKALGVGPIPGWTTNLAGTAASIGSVYGKVVGAPLSVRAALAAMGDIIGEAIFSLNCQQCERKKNHVAEDWGGPEYIVDEKYQPNSYKEVLEQRPQWPLHLRR